MQIIKYRRYPLSALSLAVAATASVGVPAFAQEKRSSTLEEVVVTAQRREESLQDTPIAITAFTDNKLTDMGVFDLSQVGDFAPNVSIRKSPSSNSNMAVNIRGVGSQDTALTGDTKVGIYIDGVYMSKSVGGVFDIVDIERLEVLRGPQGMMYGADAGGVVSLSSKTSNKPFEADLKEQVAVDSNLSGLVGDRETGNFMVCFVEGTQIDTVSGLVPVEKLNVGDLVRTVDNGSQAIRWIGSREVAATDATYPVRISAGALGTGLPSRDLQVSQQHRLLTCSRIAERMFGQSQVLIAAKKLVGMPGITLVSDRSLVAYWHILCDRHEIVLADGAPAETLFEKFGITAENVAAKVRALLS